MYAVLKPNYTKTDERRPTGEPWYVVTMECVGFAASMEEAKALHRAPILSKEPRWFK